MEHHHADKNSRDKMETTNQICMAFNSEHWHPHSAQGLVLCFSVITMGSRLFRGCDAVMELRSSLSSCDVPVTVSLKCWFPLGAVRAISLRQMRQLYCNPIKETQLLSLTPKRLMGGTSPANLLGGNSAIVGSLNTSVTLTIYSATCEDAGVYICEYLYQNFSHQGPTVVSKEERRLDLYPKFPKCKTNQNGLDFSDFRHSPVIRVRCEVKSTVKVNWVWETRLENSGHPWQEIPDSYISNGQPDMHERCQHGWVSTLLFQLGPADKTRQFRVHANYSGGQSEKDIFSTEDLKSKSPSPMEADFKTVLTIVGWLLLGVVILMFLGLMAVHLLIPRLARRDTAVSSSGSATCMFWNFPAWIRRMSSRVRNQPDQPRPPGDQQQQDQQPAGETAAGSSPVEGGQNQTVDRSGDNPVVTATLQVDLSHLDSMGATSTGSQTANLMDVMGQRGFSGDDHHHTSPLPLTHPPSHPHPQDSNLAVSAATADSIISELGQLDTQGKTEIQQDANTCTGPQQAAEVADLQTVEKEELLSNRDSSA